LEPLLERIADTLADLIPYDTLTIYRADEPARLLVPVLARDQWAEEILDSVAGFGEGLTGWGVDHRRPVLANDAHTDPRAVQIPGTPEEPESMISVPLIARDSVKGALNVYRVGGGAGFSEEEFELAQRFAAAAALAVDNAESREALERLASTDSLTGLYNHRHFHERLRSEVTRANRSQDSVALMMLDIDDFKRLNDVWGHGVGDQVLVALSDLLSEMVRASDVVCRVGGEELAVILPSCDLADALGLADRITERLASTAFDPAGHVTLSVGLAQAPDHAMNPRELVACAEAAMMSAKARGKDRVVVYSSDGLERPHSPQSPLRDLRSISHLKLLQSLAGKLNRLNDVHQIGMTIANELRTLIDYHGCRVYVAEGEDLIPIAFRGEHEYEGEDQEAELLACKVGEGITGRAARLGRSLLVPNALHCEFAKDIPGTDDIDESMIAVPLTYGTRVIGVVVISKLGADQFDQDDVRLMEVLAGNASVALENARLYEAQRREATSARALLEYSDAMSKAPSFHDVCKLTVGTAAKMLGSEQSSLWLQDERSGQFYAAAHTGYVGDPTAEAIVRMRLEEETEAGLVGGRDTPFVVLPGV
ncbi:MAG: diguanylate cyclase, partial [Actinomycetota bacterium]